MKSALKTPGQQQFLVQQPLQQQQQQQLSQKRIFVSKEGSESVSIVQLFGDSQEHWATFLAEIGHNLDIPEYCGISITLAEVNANSTSPSQLQSNDKIVVRIV